MKAWQRTGLGHRSGRANPKNPVFQRTGHPIPSELASSKAPRYLLTGIMQIILYKAWLNPSKSRIVSAQRSKQEANLLPAPRRAIDAGEVDIF